MRVLKIAKNCNTKTKRHDLSGKELKMFMDSINWTPLKEYVEKKYHLTSDPIIKVSKSSFSVFWEGDIKSQCGILGTALKAAHLQTFGCGVSQDVTYDDDKMQAFIKESNYNFSYEDLDAVYGEEKLWASFDLRYHLKHGGSNGIHLFYATYTAKEGWTFKY